MKIIFIGLDAGDVHINLNDAGINAIHRCAQGLMEHEGVRSQTYRSLRIIMTNEDWTADCTLAAHNTGLPANQR
jgi:hypothetical protein